MLIVLPNPRRCFARSVASSNTARPGLRYYLAQAPRRLPQPSAVNSGRAAESFSSLPHWRDFGLTRRYAEESQGRCSCQASWRSSVVAFGLTVGLS